MDLDRFYREHVLDDTVAREAGFNPYYPLIESGLDDPVIIENRPYINLASNNYLGLSSYRRLADAAIDAIRKYGLSMCATPVASGYSDLFHGAEEAVAAFTRLEAALIFPSCYQANNGLFKMIAGGNDLFVFDRYCHSSLIEGIRATGMANRPFRHNDPGHLESILQHASGYGQVFVVTESVFSTEGAIAPFIDIYSLCMKYGAVPVVDDSHGIGVIGPGGRGILEYSGISDYQGIYTASLGKALAVNGGVIAGKASLVNFMRYFTSHLIYSTAVSPATLGALVEVLKIIDEEFETLSSTMWRYARKIREALLQNKFILTNGTSAINSICPGNTVQTLILAKLLFREGILSTPFIFPSVPEEGGRIRLIAGANLKEASIERAIAIFKTIADGSR